LPIMRELPTPDQSLPDRPRLSFDHRWALGGPVA
jgi:hypothetical protein